MLKKTDEKKKGGGRGGAGGGGGVVLARGVGGAGGVWAGGEGIGALLLDRVLGGEHEEGERELVGRAACGDPVLLHGLEEGGLGLGGRAVDLVGEDEVGEDRALEEAEDAAAGGVVFFEDLGAGDVSGHEVGSELDALKREIEGLGKGGDQEGLGE